MSKKKYVNFTTPAGRAGFTHLHAPDTKYNKAGVYQTRLVLAPGPETTKFIELVDEQNDEAYERAVADFKESKPRRKVPYTKHEPYVELEDGSYEINFKMTASGERKDGTRWKQRPKLFDGKGKPLPAGVRVGGGSLLKVAGYFKPFAMLTSKSQGTAGASLKLSAVQILELVEFGGGNAETFGFEVEEDAFDGSNLNDDSLYTGGDDSDDADDDSDDDFDGSDDEDGFDGDF